MRCTTTDLLIDQCAHCHPQPEPEALKVSATIVARFDCRCPACGGWTQEGDPVHLVDGDWLCDGCVVA